MPLSTNAPWTEFGHSMVLRDIEQLWMAISAGNGSGLPGDGATQDKTLEMSQENGDGSGGLDLSKYATLEDINNLPSVEYPISVANGGTGSSSILDAIASLTLAYTVVTTYATGSGTFSPSKTGRMLMVAVGAGAGGCNINYDQTTLGYIATSSGGSATQALSRSTVCGGGGSGGFCCAVVSVTAGEGFNYSVGSGGAAGSGGGNSTITYASGGSLGSLSVIAGGGLVGADNYGNGTGQGGVFFITFTATRCPIYSGSVGVAGAPARTVILASSPGGYSGGGGGVGMLSVGGGGIGRGSSGSGATAGANGKVSFYEA
jgi:hypothetical protein